MGMIAFWTSSRSWTEHHERAALDASRAGGIALTPRAEGTKAHLWAIIGVACPCDLFILSTLALLPSILGQHVMDEKG